MIEKQDFLFGLRPILEAIHSGKEMDKILIKKGLTGDLYRELMGLIRSGGIPYQIVPFEKLNRITGKNHQELVSRFENKEIALRINQLLVRIEQLEKDVARLEATTASAQFYDQAYEEGREAHVNP